MKQGTRMSMTNLTIALPDELARSLEGIAAAQQKSVQQLAVDQLSSLVRSGDEPIPGSAAAILRAIQEPPHLTTEDVDELDAAIASGRLEIRNRDPFEP